MTEIENPWHSRPIDVHRWSEHPEVKALVDWIWEGYLSEEVVGAPGRKPKQPFRKQLRVFPAHNGHSRQAQRSTGPSPERTCEPSVANRGYSVTDKGIPTRRGNSPLRVYAIP